MRGVSATTIKVGATYVQNGKAASDALGAGSADPGDSRLAYNALRDEINSSGGLLGRKLEFVYHGFDASEPGTQDTATQAWCADFLEDRQVFAVLNPAPGGGPGDCLTRAGVPQIRSGASGSVPMTFRRHPAYVEVGAMNLLRQADVTVTGLAKTDFFTFDGPRKVGVVTWESSNYREAVSKGWVPQLRQRSVTSTVYYVDVPATIQGVGQASAAVSSAVLRFQREGIRHVILADGPAGVFDGGGLTLLFIRQASSQQYRPRYGLNSGNSPQAGIDAGLWSAKDMPEARAVLWEATNDYDDSGLAKNPARVACLDILRRHGVQVGSGISQLSALIACDEVFALRSILIRSGVPSLDGFTRGLNALGDTYRSTLAYRTRFRPDRHDGSSAVRLASAVQACGCFRFTSQPFAV